jgi:hypothetical protein
VSCTLVTVPLLRNCCSSCTVTDSTSISSGKYHRALRSRVGDAEHTASTDHCTNSERSVGMVPSRRLTVSFKYLFLFLHSTLSRNQKIMWTLCGHHRESPTSLGLAEEERVHVAHLHFHFSLEPERAEPEREQLIANLTMHYRSRPFLAQSLRPNGQVGRKRG